MLQQEESMLPNSAGVHEGNQRHSKSKFLFILVYFTLGVEMYTGIAVHSSHERLKKFYPRQSMDMTVCKVEHIVCP